MRTKEEIRERINKHLNYLYWISDFGVRDEKENINIAEAALNELYWILELKEDNNRAWIALKKYEQKHNVKLSLNHLSDENFLRTIPGIGNKCARDISLRPLSYYDDES